MSRTGAVAAHDVRSKKSLPNSRLVAKDIDYMGHTRVVIKSDNEPATKALAGRAKDVRSQPSHHDRSGLAERCVQTWSSCPGMLWNSESVDRYRTSARS